MTKAGSRRSAPRPESREREAADLTFGRRPTLVAVIIIVAVALAFFYRVMFLGEILTGGDVLAGAAIFDDFAKEELSAGRLPLWNPYIFGGMPFFDSMSWNGFVYPTFWIRAFIERISGVELPRLMFLVGHYILAGLAMFAYLRSHRVQRAGAVAGGLAFMLTPHLVGLSTIGHAGKVLTAAYIPLVLLAAERLMDSGSRRWLAVLALLGGLQFLARHVQVSYYTWLAVAVLVLFRLLESPRDVGGPRRALRRAAAVVAAGVLAAALAAVLLLPLHEYSAFSTRVAEEGGMGFEQATMWSFHPKELLTFLVPSLFGLSDITYWGPMPFQQVSDYVGFSALVLAILAAASARTRGVRFLTLLAAIGILLSFGKYIEPIYRALYALLPGFSRFRVPALFLLLAQFAIAGLAGHGVGLLLERTPEARRRGLTWGLGAGAAGLLVGAAVLASHTNLVGAAQAALLSKHAGAPGALVRDAAIRAAALASRDAWILMGTAVLTAAAFVAVRSKRVAPWLAAGILIALVGADVMIVDTRFVRPEKAQPLSSYYEADPAVRFLKETPGTFRIAPIGNAFSSNAWMYHRIESIGGYHPAKLALADDLIQKVGITNLNLLAVWNVRYVVGPETLDHPAFRSVAPGVHEYLWTLPRVFLVGEAKSVRSNGLALAEYGVDSFDPRRYAITAQELPGPVQSVEGSTAELVSHAPDVIEVRARVLRPCLLVFSEVYYPAGWKAFVDGVESEIYRTDYAFRSVYLEPGDHSVVMRYVPTTFRAGLIVSALAGLAIAGLLLAPARARQES